MITAPILTKLLLMRRRTRVASVVFFGALAVGQASLLLGLYQGRSAPWPLTISDSIAAISLVIFVWCMYWDIHDKVDRIAQAIVEIEEKVPGDYGWWVARRIGEALHGTKRP